MCKWLLAIPPILCAVLAIAQENVVRLGTKPEWPPYHINTQYGADGLAVRALACIMARINQPYIIIKMPWKRAQFETKKGNIDGFFAASQNEDRDEYASLSKVFLPQQRIFYSVKSNIKIKLNEYTLDHIKRNITVAARAGSNALKSLKLESFNIQATPQTEKQLLDMLDGGRVGAILENSLVFNELIAQNGKSLDDYYPVVHKTSDMGIYFGNRFLKSNPEFLERFNENVQPCSLLIER